MYVLAKDRGRACYRVSESILKPIHSFTALGRASPTGNTCHRLKPHTELISIPLAQSHTYPAQSIRHKHTMVHRTTPRRNLS